MVGFSTDVCSILVACVLSIDSQHFPCTRASSAYSWQLQQREMQKEKGKSPLASLMYISPYAMDEFMCGCRTATTRIIEEHQQQQQQQQSMPEL
jgi:hypothetical protein